MARWNWNCDITHCGDRQAFWIEWSEEGCPESLDEIDGQHFGNFAGLYCNRHTAAMRAGWSPFEEYGSRPTITLIRTAERHKLLCEEARLKEAGGEREQ